MDTLNQALARAKRSKKLLAIFYLDIDFFKKINDSFGHAMGDRLLQAFASRLKECVRRSDIVGRLGGDEFVLLLEDIQNTNDVMSIAEKIISKIDVPFVLEKQEIKATVSIGIAIHEKEICSAEELLKQADQALYLSKHLGRNRFMIYNPLQDT